MSDMETVDTPPDKEQSRGQNDSVVEPQRDWVREKASVFDDDPLDREEQPLDFSPSSTATDPRDARQDIDTEYATGRFGYTENATYPAGDLDAQSDRWRTLNEANRDFVSDDEDHIESARRRQDLHHDIQSWGRRIGLTDAEIRRATEIVTDVASGARRNFSIEVVILGALTLAANEAPANTYVAKSIRLDGPNTGVPDLVETYETIREELGVQRESVSQFRSWYKYST